ncbi:MAG: hypothetical protein FWC51_01810 [Proteobacteria bacterium]|nr:hypothetical protein [Pseudomonadota bacterium]
MKNKLNQFSQRGASMIEMMGVLALGAIMIAATFAIYRTTRMRIVRMSVSADLADLANNSKTLFSARGNYAGISVGYLIKAGALKTERAPAIASQLIVQPELEGKSFSINLTGMKYNDCVWITTQKLDWADAVYANDFREGNASDNCTDGRENKVSIFVK